MKKEIRNLSTKFEIAIDMDCAGIIVVYIQRNHPYVHEIDKSINSCNDIIGDGFIPLDKAKKLFIKEYCKEF